MIRIRLIRDPGIISAAICWWTWGQWSHVEIDNGDGWLGARFTGGVMVRPYDYCRPVAQEIRGVEMTAAEEALFWQAARGEIGRPYDWRAIAGLILRLPLARWGFWDCSEYVNFCFDRSGRLVLVTRHGDRVTPRDLGLSTVLGLLP